jgi:hypothetical protein
MRVPVFILAILIALLGLLVRKEPAKGQSAKIDSANTHPAAIHPVRPGATKAPGNEDSTKAGPARERVCFSAAETRNKIVAHKLTEPFQLLMREADQWQAEAISAKLCRWKEELVYEMNLLRHDGRVIHVFVNAVNGEKIKPRRYED